MATKPPKTGGRRGSEPALEDLIKEQGKVSEERFKEIMDNNEKIREEIKENNKKIREDILMAFQGLAKRLEVVEEEVQEIVQSNQQIENRMGGMQIKLDKNEDQVVVMQYRMMEGALRIRGLNEEKGEDLKKILSEALAEFIELDPQEVVYQIDKIYRVNSWIARQKKLPRDIVVYFLKRTVRNQILQVAFQKNLKIGEQELKVLKEIPPKMLRDRKDFTFFTQELKKYQIQFRWEVPVGLTVYYQGRRYRIDTVLKAKDFLSTVLKLEVEIIEKRIQETQMGVEAEVIPVMLSSEEQPQEQRLTRGALKRKEKEQQTQSKVQDSATEAVGGARPKIREDDLQLIAQRLQQPSNGK